MILNLKKYPFNTSEDFVHYIHHLIVGIYKSIESYEMQFNDLGNFINERNLKERPKRLVSATTYENYVYLLGGPVDTILNLFGDNANDGISYRNYRKNVKDKSKDLNIDYLEFNQEQEEQLNRLTTIRNWGHHQAVSLIHSQREKAFEEKIDTSMPICIPEYQKYHGSWLVKLYERQCEGLISYKELFKLLKQDYEKLTGSPCLVYKQDVEIRKSDESIVPIISAGIQTKTIKTTEDIQKIYNEEN